MYCIQCGVKLADSQTHCPLCGLRVYHPDLPEPTGTPLYPRDQLPPALPRPRTLSVAATIVFLLPILLVLLLDLRPDLRISWSGFVVGALLVGYVAVILPIWFEKPNPVIFTPCAFAAFLSYLLYIDLVTPGQWFLTFALPVAGLFGLICTAVVTLLRYLRKGRLYIFGGALIALGGNCLLAEFMLNLTFRKTVFIGWSLYPLITLFLLGSMLLFLAICKSARQAMERKFFL